MKKCPKCKAEIQEEARFCLYCMTSFEEKQTIETTKENNKRWLYIIAAVLVFGLIVLSVFLFIPKDNNSIGANVTSDDSSISSDLDAFDDNGITSSKEENGESEGSEMLSPSGDNQSQNNSKNEEDTTGQTSGNTTTSNTPTNGSSQNNGTTNSPTPITPSSTNNMTSSSSSQNSTTTNNTTPSSSSQNSTTTNNTTNNTSTGASSSNNKNENDSIETNTSMSTTSTPTEATIVTYSYRDAKYGDDFSVSANLENAVVITGVKTVSANGEYKIPDTIDGKKVVAIMALAFCDDSINNTVKKVFVPFTVKTIWNNAFANCYNLTDIYFEGNSIYTESNAFPETSKRNGTLTIHCSANCNDRNYRYYKNSASNYDAQYDEWNG